MEGTKMTFLYSYYNFIKGKFILGKKILTYKRVS
jgi:hypothetical protein